MNDRLEKQAIELMDACANDELRIAIITIEKVDDETSNLQLQSNMPTSQLEDALKHGLRSVLSKENDDLTKITQSMAKLQSMLGDMSKEKVLENLCGKHRQRVSDSFEFVKIMEAVTGSNAGAVAVCKQLIDKIEYDVAKSTLEFCGEKGITGTNFWNLYKGLCETNIQKFVEIVTLSRAGIINHKLLIADDKEAFEKTFEQMVAEC